MAKMRIYIVDLESVPTRYTCEWKEYLPSMLRDEVEKSGKEIEIINVSGGEDSIEATPGAFLNFQQTNIYKNNQLSDIARRFTNEIKPGDKFLFADAWHTGILQLKYMSELLGIPVEIHALWHAGSYDPQDFLGRLIKDKSWTYSTERAIYHAVDYNWFATEFHSNLFIKAIVGHQNSFNAELTGKISHTGWPMDYMANMYKMDDSQKEDIIVFPHRIAPEKQVEIFRDLAEALPEYHFVVCQDSKLTKYEYQSLLSRSKLMWSANLQETLGISPFEGALHGVVPMLPDRLSYREMYDHKYLYPDGWTQSFETYMDCKSMVISNIKHVMKNYKVMEKDVRKNLTPHLLKKYFTATNLVKKLLK